MTCECICHDYDGDRHFCAVRGCCNAWQKGFADGARAPEARAAALEAERDGARKERDAMRDPPGQTVIRCDKVSGPEAAVRCTRFKGHQSAHRFVDPECEALWNGMTYWHRAATDLQAEKAALGERYTAACGEAHEALEFPPGTRLTITVQIHLPDAPTPAVSAKCNPAAATTATPRPPTSSLPQTTPTNGSAT
jgi:hypothetical protein